MSAIWEGIFFKQRGRHQPPPPDKEKADAWETFLSASKKGIKSHQSASRKDPPKTNNRTQSTSRKRNETHEKLTSALARNASKVINQHREKTPQDDFFGLRRHHRQEEFFKRSRRHPIKKAWLFLVADVTKRWLPEVPYVTSEVPSPVRRIQK